MNRNICCNQNEKRHSNYFTKVLLTDTPPGMHANGRGLSSRLALTNVCFAKTAVRSVDKHCPFHVSLCKDEKHRVNKNVIRQISQ